MAYALPRPLSSCPTSTIAAPCAGRTISGVIAIRACLRGEDPERKRSRQLQRGFEGAPDAPSREPGVRRPGLRTCALYNAARNPRRLLCSLNASDAVGQQRAPNPGSQRPWQSLYLSSCTPGQGPQSESTQISCRLLG
jgi:hypothetical protein